MLLVSNPLIQHSEIRVLFAEICTLDGIQTPDFSYSSPKYLCGKLSGSGHLQTVEKCYRVTFSTSLCIPIEVRVPAYLLPYR